MLSREYPLTGRATSLHDTSAQSTQLNKSRLRLLQRREEHLQDLFGAARSSILELSKDEARYSQLLESIIVQVCIILLSSLHRSMCSLIHFISGPFATYGIRSHCYL